MDRLSLSKKRLVIIGISILFIYYYGNSWTGIWTWRGSIGTFVIPMIYALQIFVCLLLVYLKPFSQSVGFLCLGSATMVLAYLIPSLTTWNFTNHATSYNENIDKFSSLIYILFFVTHAFQIRLFSRLSRKKDKIISLILIVVWIPTLISLSLPWEIKTYFSPVKNYAFNGSGKSTLVESCCALNEIGLYGISIDVVPLLFLFIIFVIILIGIQVSKFAYILPLTFLFVDGISGFLSEGKIDPLTIWKKEQIDQFRLTASSHYSMAAYTYLAGLVIIVITVAASKILESESVIQPIERDSKHSFVDEE